jgi:hypothetical protein
MHAALHPVMRRFALFAAFCALSGLLCLMWASRYQRSAGLPTWRLADLRQSSPQIPGITWSGSEKSPALRVSVLGPNLPVAARLVMPNMPAVEKIQLKFRLSADHLVPGNEEWEDGRFMIEWHSPDGKTCLGTDPVGSLSCNEERGPENLVIERRGAAIPTLRLEHLGREGSFELKDLEIQVLEERVQWVVGRWFLLFAWGLWAVSAVRTWPNITWTRAVAASAIWLLMATQFAVPGPWKIQRPLMIPFHFGEEPGTRVTDSFKAQPSPMISGPLHALGKMPAQGSLALRIKLKVKQARTFLHLLLLFVPSVLTILLVGRKPALLLMILLALGIELAQLAFGYGFDLIDVIDLICDALGIALAVFVCNRVRNVDSLSTFSSRHSVGTSG